MRKIFLYVTLLSVFAFFCIELHWYISYSGNLVVIVKNESANHELLKIKIDVNGDVIIDDTLIANDFRLEEIGLSNQIGKQKLSVSREDTKEITTEEFNLFFVTWIVVDIWTDTTVVSYNYSPPLFQ